MAIGVLALMGCEKETTSAGGSDPGNYDFCNTGLCNQSAELKERCKNAYDLCRTESPHVKNEECIAAAILVCK